ncbi:tetratricopeptide repeat protein 37 [Venturia canescens]|uniref:tetratricopeptide repeat protein 37 n=1 Tax=Venturia canescens TaxID=32260 RepID=UPI001C9BCE2A|nr:tetratricopeptide repeat protein 37 [Venturia canescens]XP_043287602.1 tetratricopeptide repeat protein 37 [Venturia canescens]XP_043287688.1 tetratricopeptide repeat protein 37 [Venturia canescens]
MADVKAALKEARNHLREHRYVDAMKQCQKILKDGKDNYTALIILAAALREIEEHKAQTPVALKKAIDLNPNNPLAWQGLISFYEKEPDNVTAWTWLVPAYCKLLQLDSQSSKFSHYVTEISRLSIRLNDAKVVETVFNTLVQLKEEISDDRVKCVEISLMNLFIKYPKMTQDHMILYEKVLSSVIKDETCKDRQEYFHRYLKVLHKTNKLEALLGVALQMYEQFPKDPNPLEWICRIYSEQTVLKRKCKGVEIEEIYKALFALEPFSHLATFAKGIQFWCDNNMIESRDIVNRAVTLNPKLLYAWIFLGEINIKLHCWLEAENSAVEARQLCEHKDDEIRERIDLVLIEALAKSGNHKKLSQAIEECQKFLAKKETIRVKLLLARAYVLLDDSRMEPLLKELEMDEESQTETTVLRALGLMERGKYEEAIDVVGSALETSEAWMILGEINWLTDNYSHSVMAFLKGIQADPNNFRCFLYLGHYYRERGNDLEKSRKCYQKALRINPNSDEAGVGLSTAFRLMKNTEANMQMLLRVTTTEGGGPKWAWLQLGLQQLDQGEVSQAIKSLRYVIRADPYDNHCWESLADAYLVRGAHTSALKSYQRALELSPGSLYPMIQLANIKVVLGQHDEAKEDFGNVLSQEPRYIPALKGLAETCLGLAKGNARQQLLGRARRNAQKAADSLTDAIVENSELSCIWKLLGDACYSVAVLPDKYCYLAITPGLVKSDSKDDQIIIRKTQLFVLASRCFCRALNLSKDSSLLWHDLACCYLSQMRCDPNANRLQLAEKSLAAAKQAVKLCPSTWVHWNMLTAVCMTEEVKNYALAQHCCVMAIDREPNNAIAWTNLGTLYLNLGDHYKANEAFSRAQRADPEYLNSWIGQGMIAEAVHRKEAMDLYRHATSLGYHSQAAIGYAHWVLTTLLDAEAKKDPLYTYTIENMHAVTVATDAMTWYIERVPMDACGRNVLGLLLERQKLVGPAACEFHEAIKLEKDETKKDFVRINLARVVVQLGEYEKSVEACKDIKTASFKSHCQLALSLFKARRFEESYAAYEATLNWLADAGSDKAHVLCAMAAMAYMFQEVDDVKTLLFQCIQIQPPTVAGLLAAAALGLLHDDSNLTGLVLHELEPYKDEPENRHHVAILTAYSCLVHGDIDKAIRVLSKAVHRHPDDIGSWVGLVKILLQCNSRAFAHCAQKAMMLGRKISAVGVSQVACISSLGDLTDEVNDAMVEVQRKTKDSPRKGLRSVQKTIFSFPGNVESWANFIVALSPGLTASDAKPNAAWIAGLISIIRKQFKTTKPMDDWLSKNETEATNIASSIRSRGNKYPNMNLAA